MLVRPAGLVVLDEPEQRLDDAGRMWLAERLRRLADDGAAIVLASHDEQLVEDVAAPRPRARLRTAGWPSR